MARHDVVALAKSLSLADATRYVSMLQLSGIANNETANPLTNTNTDIRRAGAQLDLRIPIFDTGEARLRSARCKRQVLRRRRLRHSLKKPSRNWSPMVSAPTT